MDRVVDCHSALADIAAAVVRGIVLQTQICDSAPQFLRQSFISTVHAAEIGVAPFGRNLQRINDAGLRRVLEVRHVGMPRSFAGAEAADRFSIFDDIGDDIDFRMSLDKTPPGLLNWRPIELTKEAAE